MAPVAPAPVSIDRDDKPREGKDGRGGGGAGKDRDKGCISYQNSRLRRCKSNASNIGGGSIICNLCSSGITLDDSQLPEKLIVILNCNSWSATQFLLLTGCLPGFTGLLCNMIGSVDELHFERQPDGTVNMTKLRRHCTAVVKERPIKVMQVGSVDENLRGDDNSSIGSGDVRGGVSNSNSDSPNSSQTGAVENLVVIDGNTGAKAKEDHLIVNGHKVVTSPFQNFSMDVEGDTSTLVKAFCNFPLSYEEYNWVEENAPDFLPDTSTMTHSELTMHKIQMLQLNLQRIQHIEEKQALGVILTPYQLNMMGQRQRTSDQLASLKFNLSVDEIRNIRECRTDDLIEKIEEGAEEVIEENGGMLVLNYDDGISEGDEESQDEGDR